ncbi:Glycoside hydrolase 2 (Mannanase, beta-galactosidase) [Tilletia horrida]|nr:Glycoside hydrolase 2 (Mannanase, beta-galactosidase) [Tilletia horrida]
MEGAGSTQTHRAHRPAIHGPKAEAKKKTKEPRKKGNDPRAFISANPRTADKLIRRNAERDQQRLHVPLVNRTPDEEPPPVLVAVVGPEGVGKTTLVRSLIRRYTKHSLAHIAGPLTVVSGKKRRITFVECNNDINSMIDIGKVADLILLMIDGSFGFEMETMEFLNILQAHGFPKVIGVLTHLDLIKKAKTLRATKKRLKQRFWTEIYQGAKLFYLSGVINGRYPDTEIQNLSRFISVMKFRPLQFRNSHPHLLADRLEDLTPREQVRLNPKADRIVTIYGYLRGTNLRRDQMVHIPGVGDLRLDSVERLADPCPLPDNETEKRRKLADKARLIHAPMSDVGGILFDKDAVYVNVPGNFTRKRGLDGQELSDEEDVGEGERMVMDLQDAQRTLDDHARSSAFRIFGDDENATTASASNHAESSRHATSLSRVRRAAFEEDVRDVEDEDEDEGEDDGQYDEDGEDEEDDDEDVEGADSDEEEVGNRTSLRRASSSRRLAQMPSSYGPDETDENIAYAETDSELGFGDDADDHLPSGHANRASIAQQTVLANRARKPADWMHLVYSTDKPPLEVVRVATHGWEQESEMNDIQEENIEDDDDDDFFRPANGNASATEAQQASLAGPQGTRVDRDVPDQLRMSYEDQELAKWEDEKFLNAIRHLFITGGEGQANGNEDGDEGGDFEDLEEPAFEDLEGKEYSIAQAPAIEDEETRTAALAAKKEALKKKFDEQYDDDEDEGGDKDWYDEQKAELQRQADVNRAEFEGMDQEIREAVQGFLPGTYVRLQMRGVPCELVENFEPSYPLIVGGLLAAEEEEGQMGYVQVRLKKHRWFPRQVLKTNDPIIFSMGWRRFQTIPVYSLNDGTRNRMLKYTPQHMHCLATFWGPPVQLNSGFCAFNTLGSDTPAFRISATGTVLSVDRGALAHGIVKKLKLTGYPTKVFKNTAFIRGMFNSALEVAKFEGAHLKTVSGIRGQVKRALAKPEGNFRATFEDKILMSDIIFLRAWYAIEPRKFYNPVCSLLLSPDSRQWQGMRLTGAVRRDERIKGALFHADSHYKPVERAPAGQRKFNPLKVPKSLQAALPFNSKPKDMTKQGKKTYMQKRAVILEDDERAAMSLLQQMRAVQKEKAQKRSDKNAERLASRQKNMLKAEGVKAEKRKAEMKEQYRMAGQREKKRQKM